MEENQQNKPRKVFISVLGAGFYGECVYGKDDKIIDGQPFRSSSTRFVQQATLEYLDAKNWCADDAAYILVTKGAKQTNWNKSIVTRKKFDGSEEAYTGLEKVIEDMHLPFPTKAVDIKDGKNEEEIWDIFDTIISDERGFIQEGDELYFDLTHGFRYLPMLVLVLGNYSKFLKHTKKCSITYGNFEMREDGVAPIIDLLPLASLQDWTYAVADYLENGYAEQLNHLGKESLVPILSNIGKPTDAETRLVAANLNKLINTLNSISIERQLCRGISVTVSKNVKNLKDLISKSQNGIISAFMPLIHQIDYSLKDFDVNENPNNAIAAARWCFDNKQYQAATTFLKEGVVSFFCRRHKMDFKNIDMRDLVTSAFHIKSVNLDPSKWNVDEANLSYLRGILSDPLLDTNLLNVYSDFCDKVRNDYNHCGFRKQPLPIKTLLSKIEYTLSFVENLIQSDSNLLPQTDGNPKPLIFLNISNHPISEWKEDQLEAAKQYGEIQEKPFPTIDPTCNQTHIDSLVNEYVNQLAEMSMKDDLTVHVMGEMTFTYNLVARLKAMGIRCVASTTERHTHLDADGNKVSEFKFVQFREY